MTLRRLFPYAVYALIGEIVLLGVLLGLDSGEVVPGLGPSVTGPVATILLVIVALDAVAVVGIGLYLLTRSRRGRGAR